MALLWALGSQLAFSATTRLDTSATTVTITPNNPRPGDPFTVKVEVFADRFSNGKACGVDITINYNGSSNGAQHVQLHFSNHPQGSVTRSFNVASGASGALLPNISIVGNSTASNERACNGGGSLTAPPPSNNPTVAPTPTPQVALLSKRRASTQQRQVTPGATVDFVLRYQNVGSGTASTVTIEDTLPAGLTFDSATPRGKCANTPPSQVVTCSNLGPLDPHSSVKTVTIRATVDPTATGVLENRATLTFDGPTITPPRTADVEVLNTPKVVLRKTINNKSQKNKVTSLPGERLTYYICYRNAGNADATGVQIIDTLSDQLDSAAASVTVGQLPGVTHTYNANTREVAWTVGTVRTSDPEKCVTVSATLLPNATGDVSNTATATSTNSSNSTSNLAYTDVAREPFLTMSKVPSQTIVSPGQSVTYTITYSNIGSATAPSPILTDTLPPNTTVKDPAAFSSGNPSYDSGTRTIRWDLPPLPAGSGDQTQTYEVIIDSMPPAKICPTTRYLRRRPPGRRSARSLT